MERGDESMRENAKPIAAWARRWNVKPGRPCGEFASAFDRGEMGVVRPGWIPLLDRLAEDLIALGWDGTLEQAKQKFGELRFYWGQRHPALAMDVLDAIKRRVVEATAESIRTCEGCGAPGRRCDPGGRGFIETLCPRCFEAEDAEVRARAAEDARIDAKLEAEWRAQEEELAKADPEYRKYLEEFVPGWAERPEDVSPQDDASPDAGAEATSVAASKGTDPK